MTAQPTSLIRLCDPDSWPPNGFQHHLPGRVFPGGVGDRVVYG
jgi:hypothetical protein